MDRLQVFMDSAKSPAMVVKTKNKDMSFIRLDNNLFVYKPKKVSSDDVDSAFATEIWNTTVDVRRYYSERQLKRADAARTLMHTLAYPTFKDMKAVLKMNSIEDCPVTEQDVDLAIQIYGPDMASLKGKTTRRKPSLDVEDVVSLPAELINAQRDVVLSIDTLFVNGMAFLTTISAHIRYRTAQWVL
jgi:hypothetical protein